MARSDLSWVIIITLLMELLTCLLRFCIGMRPARDTSWLAPYTFRVRIHHGYLGVIAILSSVWFAEHGAVREWALTIGTALVLSDLIHHFLVLWPIQGNPEFDLTCPLPDASPDHTANAIPP